MTANRIHALPLHLANQIAAGEVIERPASVVKELIENSIDANATQITINIEGAGSQLIRIQDNGMGIHPDDLAIALSRHATSKIDSSEQLSHISSLGFRGEALPSIASISRLTLISRQADSECGYKLSANDTEKSPVSAPYGTQIEVRDLFFNLPARRRFLRSNNTEQHHILTTIQRLALSQFHIGFHYKNAVNTKLKLAIADTDEKKQQRIAKICGNTFLNNSLYLKQNFDDIELSGWLAKADAHRAQTDIQYFFINGRVIRDRVINHAIRQAYGDLIPAGRHPAYVLYLSIPLDSVDINVHPTKHEVRFRNARLVHGLIISAIQDALASIDQTKIKSDIIQNNVSEKSSAPYFSSNLITDKSVKKTELDSSVILGKPITLLEQRYSINQTTQGTLLIDLQKAKQEFVRDQLRDAIKNGTLRSRPILVPFVISTNKEQIKAAIFHRELLEKLAIHCQQQDKGLIITAIPSLLSQVDLKSFMSDILSLLTKEQKHEQQLIHCLQKHIPLTAIQNIEQANKLLQQLRDSSIKKEWYITLDKLTLSSLF